jgi:chorismate synthase
MASAWLTDTNHATGVATGIPTGTSMMPALMFAGLPAVKQTRSSKLPGKATAKNTFESSAGQLWNI